MTVNCGLNRLSTSVSKAIETWLEYGRIINQYRPVPIHLFWSGKEGKLPPVEITEIQPNHRDLGISPTQMKKLSL